MSLYNIICKNIIMPVTDVITGYSFNSSLKLLEKSQFWDKDTIRNYQNSLLIKLLKEANGIEYYQELFKRISFNINELKSQEDLKFIPILTKKTIKEYGIKCFTNTAKIKSDCLLSSSSGSTGEPLFYHISKKAYSINIASNIRGWQWMGYKMGDKFIKLSQNPRNRLIKKIQDIILRNNYISINPINNDTFESIVNSICKFNPKFIRCYPDPLFLFTRYVKDMKFNDFVSIRAINTTGNTLFEGTRKEIEEVFNLKIFDSYSCEGTPTAFECNTHDHYHFADEYGIVEVLDDNNNPVTEGIGRLISTDLWNYAHPFIRYDTQDLVEISNERCVNGIQLKQIKKIIGRSNDILKLKNGTYLIVHNFTGFFQTDHPELKRSILRFQVIKRGSSIVFNLVVNENYDTTVESFILKYWEKITDCSIRCNLVEKFDFTKSGKHRFIINED